MNRTRWIVLGTIFVVLVGGAAGLVGVMLFSSGDDSAEMTGGHHEDVIEPRVTTGGRGMHDGEVGAGVPPPALRGVDAPSDAAMARRLTALEGEVESLKEALAAERARTKPVLDMLEAAKSAGAVHLDGDIPDGPPGMAGEILSGARLAHSLARKAGLSPKRAKAFVAEYEQTLEKIKALEKANATVSKEGDTTTIKLARYEDAGARLRREWDDHVESTLTEDERATYDKEGGSNQLLGSRMGRLARTITIKEADGAIVIAEEARGDEGTVQQQHMQGPAVARDMLLEDYAHLLR